jgi:hypothetical protein
MLSFVEVNDDALSKEVVAQIPDGAINADVWLGSALLRDAAHDVAGRDPLAAVHPEDVHRLLLGEFPHQHFGDVGLARTGGRIEHHDAGLGDQAFETGAHYLHVADLVELAGEFIAGRRRMIFEILHDGGADPRLAMLVAMASQHEKIEGCICIADASSEIGLGHPGTAEIGLSKLPHFGGALHIDTGHFLPSKSLRAASAGVMGDSGTMSLILVFCGRWTTTSSIGIGRLPSCSIWCFWGT